MSWDKMDIHNTERLISISTEGSFDLTINANLFITVFPVGYDQRAW